MNNLMTLPAELTCYVIQNKFVCSIICNYCFVFETILLIQDRGFKKSWRLSEFMVVNYDDV